MIYILSSTKKIDEKIKKFNKKIRPKILKNKLKKKKATQISRYLIIKNQLYTNH